MTKKLPTLPKTIYVKYEQYERDETQWLVAQEEMNDLVTNVGDKVKIGVYELVDVKDAEGIVRIKS